MAFLRAVLFLVALLFFLPPAGAQDWNSQAVALQTRQDWNGLRALAERWTKAEPRNFGAWADLGVACDMLQQHQQAALAYERSLDLQPNGMTWMQLGADYHLLHQPDKLKALYERLQKSNPQGAAMLATQYAADLTPGSQGPPQVPSDLPRIASIALIEARQWAPDATLTTVSVNNFSGRQFDVAFTFISRGKSEVMQMIGSQSGGLISKQTANAATESVPRGFIDLPRAVDISRRAGMRGALDHAVLTTWHGATGKAVAAWVVTPVNDGTFQVFAVDAVSGALHRSTDVFGDMPGNDRELRGAIDKVKQAFAPPAAPAAATAWRPSGSTVPGWVAAKQANYERWKSDYYLHNNFPNPMTH